MLPASSKRRRWRLDQSGATALEFGLVGPVFLMLLLGTIELARYSFIKEGLRTLTAEAARKILITYNTSNFTCPTDFSNVLASANVRTPFLVPGNLANQVVLTTSTCVNGAPNVITVTVTYSYSTILPLLSFLSGPMVGQTVLTF